MVRASTIVLATTAIAVAPALAAPAGHHQAHRAGGAGHVHTVAPTSAAASPAAAPAELEAREPKFRLGKAFKSIGRIAKSASGIAMKAAPLLLRDVEDLDELDARDFEGPEEIDARNPFNWGKAFRGVARVAKTAGGIAMKVAPLVLRDEEGNIYDIRDFEELEEIDARNPINWGKAFRGVAKVAKTAGRIGLKAAPLLLREVDDLEELDARDFVDADSEDLIFVRDVDGELYVLDAREPRFNLKKALHKVSNIAHKAVGVANKVTGVMSQFGYRDLEDVEERDVEEEMNEVRKYEASLDELD